MLHERIDFGAGRRRGAAAEARAFDRGGRRAEPHGLERIAPFDQGERERGVENITCRQRVDRPWKISPAASVSTAVILNTGSSQIAPASSRQRTGLGPSVTARNAFVVWANLRKAAARSSVCAVARRPSAEKITCELAANSGSPGCAGLSASSTTGSRRRRAAWQIGNEKAGNRLSASTASTPATSASASGGVTASSR